MTVLVDLPLPEDWHVLDLDPVSGPDALGALVSDLRTVLPGLADPDVAAATREHYARAAEQQRQRGVLLSAFLLGRDEAGVLAAALEALVVPLGEPVVAPAVAAHGLALVLARTVAPDRDVARLDLPAGPAVGLRDVVRDDETGERLGGVAQVWVPLGDGRALVLALATPCPDDLDGFTRLLATVARGLLLEPAPSAYGPIDRHSRARSAAT